MLRAGTAPENQAYLWQTHRNSREVPRMIGNSRRIGERDALVSGRRRLDAFRYATQRVGWGPVDLNGQDGIERRVELERRIAARVADDTGAFLHVVAGIVRVTVDP